ncbi:S-protein homolog 5-like [Raphanus sativus]|uniref:S-protein homolog n=1 Tax=Raphanus sativus TaxID=3726 RepID=A0A6J0JSP9_RAPSA|nr:S-protein homolog 5-like [Raphanus sativus]
MAFSSNIHFIFILITFLTILKTSLSFGNISPVDGILPFSPKHVVITNKLVAQFGLLVHCTNKETDLGVRSVLINQSFGFRFRVNLFKTTNYNCVFSWPGIVRTFDIFRADRDDNSRSKCGICSECIWYISESGPCRIRRDGGPPCCFPWSS